MTGCKCMSSQRPPPPGPVAFDTYTNPQRQPIRCCHRRLRSSVPDRHPHQLQHYQGRRRAPGRHPGTPQALPRRRRPGAHHPGTGGPVRVHDLRRDGRTLGCGPGHGPPRGPGQQLTPETCPYSGGRATPPAIRALRPAGELRGLRRRGVPGAEPGAC